LLFNYWIGYFMKTLTLAISLVLVVLVVTSSVVGAYYYMGAVSPQNTSPTPTPTVTAVPTPSVSPNSSPTPFQSPSILPTPTSTLSPTPTSNPSTSPTVTPTPTPTPTLSPTPAPWSLVNVTDTKTSFYLHTYSAGGTGYIIQPNETDYIYLLVKFELSANDNANTLDVQDIVLLVDGTYQLRPVGLSPTTVVSSYQCFVGNFTGTINPTIANFSVFLEKSGTKILDDTITSGTHPAFIFIYRLPQTSLDGTHSLELRIAGATSGVSFTVQPP
jgi:hypothetical protein